MRFLMGVDAISIQKAPFLSLSLLEIIGMDVGWLSKGMVFSAIGGCRDVVYSAQLLYQLEPTKRGMRKATLCITNPRSSSLRP